MALIIASYDLNILSPQEKSTMLLDKAHTSYKMANETTNFKEAYLLLEQTNHWANMARKYDPQNIIISKEALYFKTAFENIETNKTQYSTNHYK